MTDAYGAQASTHRGSNLPGLALLAGLAVLLLVAVGWGWTAQRRVANAEAAAATATAERETGGEGACRGAGFGRCEWCQDRGAGAAGAGARRPARGCQRRRHATPLRALGAGCCSQCAHLRQLQHQRRPAAETVAALGSVEPAAAPPAPEPAAEPERLTITFEVNSSFLPSGLDGRLHALAEQLAAGPRLRGPAGRQRRERRRRREVGRRGARYNRWIAERRVERVADFLQRTAKGRI